MKMMPPDVRFKGQNAQNSISTGAPPRPRWGGLSTLPNPLAGLKGILLLRKGRKRGGETRQVGFPNPEHFSKPGFSSFKNLKPGFRVRVLEYT